MEIESNLTQTRLLAPCHLLSESISIHLRSGPTFVNGNKQIAAVPFTMVLHYRDGTTDTASGYLSSGKLAGSPADDLVILASSDFPPALPPDGVESSAGNVYALTIYPNGAIIFWIEGPGFHSWRAHCSLEKMTWTGKISTVPDPGPVEPIPIDKIPVWIPPEFVWANVSITCRLDWVPG